MISKKSMSVGIVKRILNKIVLLVGTIALAFGFLLLFFGGTWQGVRFALELFGVIYIFQLTYSVLKEERQEKIEKEKLDKYFDK